MFTRIPFSILLLSACVSDKGVTIFNPNPEVEITSHETGEDVMEGSRIIFMGNVTDPNHNPEQLTASWKTGAEELCPPRSPSIDGTSTCEIIITADMTEITLEAKDIENARGEDTISLVVVPSEKPVAEIITPISSGVYYSDQIIIFEGLLQDAEDDASVLTAFWESNRDGILSSVDSVPESDGSILGYAYLSEGEHALELTVEDSTGKTDRDTVIIQVGPPNSPPACEIFTPEDFTTGTIGELVFFTGWVSDLNIPASMLEISWVSDKDGFLGISTPDSFGMVSFPFADLSVNTHVVSMIVVDEVGEECVANRTYTVGTPPSIQIDAPLDGSIFNVGESILFAATVSDTQDLPSNIALDWSLNGATISTQTATSSGIASFSDSTLSFGTYNLVVTATDSEALTDSDQVSFTINGVPSQPQIHIQPDPAFTTDSLGFVFDSPSTDPEGSSISYTYEWLLGGVLQNSYTTSTLPASATHKGEQWSIRITPHDGITSGAAGTASIVISNSPPTISSILITPAAPSYGNDTLTCIATAIDPDETPNIAYAWSIGGIEIGSTDTIDLSTTGASPNDTLICTVTASDGDGATATDSTQRNIQNALPVVDSIVLDPSMVYTNDTITATAVFSDIDNGQSITGRYDWHVIDALTGVDSLVQSSSQNAIDGSVFFNKNDTIYVIVTPNDGIDDGTPASSSSLTISNSAPSEPSISLSPNPASAGQDDLVCTIDVQSVDIDGDTTTYIFQWIDPSGIVQQTTTTNTAYDTFLGTSTTIGLWTCTLQPFDGVDYGPTVSTSTDVGDTCLTSGLVLDIDFNTGAPIDNSSFGHAVAIENSQSTSDRFALPNQAWNFSPSVNSRLVIPSSANLVFSNEISVSMYVRFKQSWNYHAESLMWKFPHPSTEGFHLGVDQNNSVYGTGMYQISFLIPSAGANATQIVSFSEISEWFHVVGTFEQGLAQLYINGQLVATDTGTPTMLDSIQDLILGGSSHPVSGAYNRDIDNVKVHSCALSAQEVLDMYQADNDGDGYSEVEDCNDNDASIYPFAGDTYGDGIDSDCDGFDCEADTDTNGVYFTVCVDTVERSFAEAAFACTSSGYDGLSLPMDASENNTIFSLSQAVWAQRPLHYNIRLGGTDAAAEGTWLHDRTGLALPYLNWASSEPTNSYGNEHCINMIGDVSYNGLWQDLGCHKPSNGGYAWSCETR